MPIFYKLIVKYTFSIGVCKRGGCVSNTNTAMAMASSIGYESVSVIIERNDC